MYIHASSNKRRNLIHQRKRGQKRSETGTNSIRRKFHRLGGLLTINNTNVVVAFAAATNTFAETAGVVPVNVVRFNNTTNTSTVNFYTTDGTAQSNVNYTATSGTLTFHPGEVSKTIAVNLIHDSNYTGTVSFNMNLSNPGVGVQIGAPNPAIVQVTDAEAGLSFTNSALSVAKGAASILVAVVCANTNVEPVLVN